MPNPSTADGHSALTAHSARTDRLHLPVAAYLFVMLIALALGSDAVYVNREYAYSSLEMLGLSDVAMAVRKNSIDLLLLADIAMFFIAALMPRERFRALRWKLLALGVLIWAFDCAHMYQARFGIVMSGKSASTATAQRGDDLRASITSMRATAASLRTSAARQSASILGASRADGSASLREALAADQRAEALSAELATVERGKAPAEADIWGEWMPLKAFAESLLISLVGLLMFGLAGEMVRAARDAYPGSRATSRVSAKGGALPSWTTRMPKPSPAYAAAVMPMGAMAAPMAAYPPPLPTPPSISAPSTVLTQAHPPVLKQAQPAPTPASSTVLIPAQSAVPESAQPQAAPAADTPMPKVKKKRVRAASATAVADGAKIDTGTTGKAAARYERVKAKVLAGQIKPSVRSIQSAEGGSTLIARRYQQQLAAEGVIVRNGQGWAAAPQADASQMSLM